MSMQLQPCLLSASIRIDRAPAYFNNKGTGIAYDDLHMLLLYSLVQREAVFKNGSLHFNCIFMVSEVASTSAEEPKECITNICHVSGILDHYLIIYMHFVWIQRIFIIHHVIYNIYFHYT